MKKCHLIILFFLAGLTTARVYGQLPAGVNKVESNVIPYTLPDP